MTDHHTFTAEELINLVWADHQTRFPDDPSAKYTADDVDNDLYSLADLYVRDYEGEFDFLVDVKAKLDLGNTLSSGAAKGVLNCMLAAKRRSIGGGGGSIPLTALPALAYYAVPHDDFIDLYHTKTWTPKGSEDELIMVEATNVPDSAYTWGMAAVIDPAAMTARILNKIQDPISRGSLTTLLKGTTEEHARWIAEFSRLTGRDAITGRVTDRAAAAAFKESGSSPF